MEAYQDYLNMFNFFNVGTIIVTSVVIIFIYIGISAIKHNMLVSTIKKAVKDAIKELNADELNKNDQNNINKEDINQK
jgi:hypothetical protein